MNEARWEHIQEIFNQAVELTGEQQDLFLDQACGGEAGLLTEVRDMLRADHADTSTILDQDLDEIASELLGAPGESIPLQEFGPYRPIRHLGEGGMGVVWLAERKDAGNLVAIKFLPHAGLSPTRQERFAQEIRTLARFHHSYIARLYDAGTLSDGTPWFVMEYVDGVPFREYIRSSGRTVEEKLRLFRQVCEAVQYAHSQEIIHRDLKPSNIMVAADGTPRLLDFGIAREVQQLEESGGLTQSGIRFFSANYSAPEWVLDGAVGFRIDVYSLGIILYEMLTGQLPFRTPPSQDDFPVERPSQVARRSEGGRTSPDRRISATAWKELDVLCLKAMRRNSAERYPSVEALLRDIDHYLKHEPLEARPDSLLYRTNRFFRRHRASVLAASAVALLIAGMIIFFTLRLAKSRNAALAEAVRARRIQQFMLTLIGASDEKAAPSDNLRVKTLLDHGAREAAYLGSDPEAQADLYQNLGAMYDMLGEYSRSQQFLQLALDRRQASHSDDARTAETLTQIGIVKADAAQDATQFKEAEGYAQKGLDLVVRRLPFGDPRVLSARAALGRIIAESGDSQRAITLLTPIVVRQPDDTQADYALSDSFSTVIGAEYNAGEIAQAEALTSRALKLDRHLFGPDHPQIAVDLVDAGLSKAAGSHFAEAEPLYRQAIEIEKAWYGPNHPDLADFEGFLARALHEQGKLAESESLLQNALQVQKHVYGGENDHVAVTLDTLGEIQMDRGSLHDAELTFAHAVAIDQAELGNKNYQTAIIAADLGEAYRQEKQYSRAIAVLSNAVRTLQSTLPTGALNIAIAQRSLGRALLALHHYRDAEIQLNQAYLVYKSNEHPVATDLNELRQDLAAARAAEPINN
jgi:eukaryotic-like serine/threonine-protein kinase